MVLNKDFREFIESLNSNDVRYLIVGGYAVGLHGHLSFIDLENLKKNKKSIGRLQDLADLENLESKC